MKLTMTSAMNLHLRLLVLLVAALLSACFDGDMGVVARVNGHPIHLAQLEFQHDLLHMDSSGTTTPSVDSLRAEYGRILGDLIVLELVRQDLKERGLSVTDEELKAEEDRVRADYPEGTFDQMLVEEYIDLADWRQQVRYTLAREKFNQLVLRPQIHIDYREAEKYYETHLDDFRVPASVHVITVCGVHRDDVEHALKIYRAVHDPQVLHADLKGVAVREMTVPQENLSTVWHNALQELPTGEASPVMEVCSGFEALVLIDCSPAKLLDPSTAYPQMEERLLEQKLQVAFEYWLKKELARAEIRISERLLPKVGKADQPLMTEPDIAPSLQPVPQNFFEATPLPDEGGDEPQALKPGISQSSVKGNGMPFADEDGEEGLGASGAASVSSGTAAPLH